MPKIQEFKQRYCGLRLPWFDYLSHSVSYEFFMSRLTELDIEVHSVMTPHSQPTSQVSGSSQLSLKDAFL